MTIAVAIFVAVSMSLEAPVVMLCCQISAPPQLYLPCKHLAWQVVAFSTRRARLSQAVARPSQVLALVALLSPYAQEAHLECVLPLGRAHFRDRQPIFDSSPQLQHFCVRDP